MKESLFVHLVLTLTNTLMCSIYYFCSYKNLCNTVEETIKAENR